MRMKAPNSILDVIYKEARHCLDVLLDTFNSINRSALYAASQQLSVVYEFGPSGSLTCIPSCSYLMSVMNNSPNVPDPCWTPERKGTSLGE